jgi:hypothetical protein
MQRPTHHGPPFDCQNMYIPWDEELMLLPNNLHMS